MGQKHVLLLNIGYTPVGVVTWQRAVNLVMFRGKAVIEREYDDKLSAAFNAAVIRLTVKSPDPYHMFEKQKFSKRHLFMRDRNTCQYCADKLSHKELTIDHVLPRSLGGKTHYLNCVASCKPCNARKGSRTPDQAGMKLLNPIRKPTMYDILHSFTAPGEWDEYIASM